MDFIDLYTGGGAGSIAVDRVWGEEANCLGFSEIEKPAIRVYQSHFPNHPLLGDVTGVNFGAFRGRTKLAFGGSPCQDLSISRANRKGLKGSKSKLFWEFKRMVDEARPEYFFLENVESMSDEDRDIISEELGCMPVEINSRLVSGQNRKRYYWANFPITQPTDWGIHVTSVLEKLTTAKQNEYEITFPCWDYAHELGLIGKGNRGYRPEEDRPFFRAKREGKKFISWTMPQGPGQVRLKEGDVLVWSKSGRGDDIHEERVSLATKSNTLTTGEGCSSQSGRTWVVLKGGRIRMLTPLECERLQGYPDHWTKDVSPLARYKMMGNSFTVDVIEHILRCAKATMEKNS